MKKPTGNMSLSVNKVVWTEKDARQEIACASCEKPTKGRIGRKPMCMDCAFRTMLKPIGDMVRKVMALQ